MSTNYDQMEEIWGLAAIFSEYQIDDRICYTVEGQTHTGTIIWVCAPTNTVETATADTLRHST